MLSIAKFAADGQPAWAGALRRIKATDMSELIDVACEICGQKYRWSPEKIGSTAACRECGTRFEVAEYTPPPEDGADNGSPWPWIKGACVAALVIGSVVGLGSLPFVRPAPAGAVVADNRQPNARNFGRAAPQVQNGQVQNPVIPDTPRPNVDPGADIQQRMKEMQEKMNVPRGALPGAPTPRPGFPRGGRRMPGFGRPQTGQPENPANRVGADAPTAPNTAPQNQSPGKAPEPTGIRPVITGWRLTGQRGNQELHLTGRGLKNTTKVQKTLHLGLFNAAYGAVSDSELVLRSVSLQDDGPMLLVVTTPDGVAVVFSEDLQTVDSTETFDAAAGPRRPCLVKKGGDFTTYVPTIVLIENGGRARISGITAVGFVKQGGVLETAIAQTLFIEEGARITEQAGAPRKETVLGALTFCPLPRPRQGN